MPTHSFIYLVNLYWALVVYRVLGDVSRAKDSLRKVIIVSIDCRAGIVKLQCASHSPGGCP